MLILLILHPAVVSRIIRLFALLVGDDDFRELGLLASCCCSIRPSVHRCGIQFPYRKICLGQPFAKLRKNNQSNQTK